MLAQSEPLHVRGGGVSICLHLPGKRGRLTCSPGDTRESESFFSPPSVAPSSCPPSPACQLELGQEPLPLSFQSGPLTAIVLALYRTRPSPWQCSYPEIITNRFRSTSLPARPPNDPGPVPLLKAKATHHIGLTTVPLTFYWESPHRRGDSIPCPSQSGKQWRFINSSLAAF